MSQTIKRVFDDRKILDISIFLAAFTLTHTAHQGMPIVNTYVSMSLWAVANFIFIALSGSYSRYWRYTSLGDLRQMLTYLAFPIVSALPILCSIGFTLLEAVAMAAIAIGGSTLARLWRRVQFERRTERDVKINGLRTLIIGTNRKAQLLAHRAVKDASLYMWPVAFVGLDNKSLGMRIEGIEVVGELKDIVDVCIRFKIQELVIAENFDGDLMAQVLKKTRALNIRPRVLTGHGLESSEAKKYELFKDVNLEDLLSRDKVVVDTHIIAEEIKGKTILVSGAGGSIGSELCRQIMAMGPAKIILVDHSEFNLYSIHKELNDLHPHLKEAIVPILMDVKESEKISILMQEQAVNFVYHAAAYKHVHLVEMNPLISIRNNIIGTRNVIRACEENGIERFVLISSDKAVNPTSVMGATKRICELLTTLASQRTGRKYCSVRFGNVLGSSGSFIPLLKQQVRNGGPVTITDPRMQRYFMTIPEAVSLVLEASRISSPGDINVLKMGEPIMIVDIAKKIITLLGKTEKDVPIVFTGIRPGEKLYEELYLCGDEMQTHHKDIVVLPHGDALQEGQDINHITLQIDAICDLALTDDPQAVIALRDLVELHKRAKPELSPIAVAQENVA